MARSLCALAALLAVSSCFAAAAAAQSPADIVTNIQMLTTMTQALQPLADSINEVSGVELAVNMGPYPKIDAGLANIVTTVQGDLAPMQATPPIAAGADATAIDEAFRGFVQVLQTLLNTLIAKADLLKDIPNAGGPVVTVLRSLEGALDSFSFALIAVVPSESADVNSQSASLTTTLEAAIKAYSGTAVVP